MTNTFETVLKRNLISAYKKEGESWKNALERARLELNLSSDTKLSILGRLDEMAEGLILIGIDVSADEKQKLIDTEKVYEWSLLLGATTDTHDILGLVESVWDLGELPHDFNDICVNVSGELILPYPAFSSKNIGGEPLWKLSREGADVEMPNRKMNIISHELLETKNISSKNLLQEITERIQKVEGDFRQEEILGAWQKALVADCNLIEVRFKTEVSSGTYIRAVAHSWGQKLGCGAIALRIKRTKIGEFVLCDIDKYKL
ncbi:MAG: hypothetical protein WA051_01835 [Minisyncoccia bacterium]